MDPVFGILETGCWVQDQKPGSSILDPGSCTQDCGSRILNLGLWIQDPGAWSRMVDVGSSVQNPDSGAGVAELVHAGPRLSLHMSVHSCVCQLCVVRLILIYTLNHSNLNSLPHNVLTSGLVRTNPRILTLPFYFQLVGVVGRRHGCIGMDMHIHTYMCIHTYHHNTHMYIHGPRTNCMGL